MKYGVLSGMLWGLDTVVLAMALALIPFAGSPDAPLTWARRIVVGASSLGGTEERVDET